MYVLLQTYAMPDGGCFLNHCCHLGQRNLMSYTHLDEKQVTVLVCKHVPPCLHVPHVFIQLESHVNFPQYYL